MQGEADTAQDSQCADREAASHSRLMQAADYYFGHGVEKSPEKAVEILREEAEAG